MQTHMHAHDPSHNPAHVHRVVALAQSILAAERALHPEIPYDSTTVTLAAILHDINDRKYASSATNASTDPDSSPVRDVLLANGAAREMAERVDVITAHVSYSTERKNPGVVERLVKEEGYPELAVVQDADRLDALGAVGVGRCFTYLGASVVRDNMRRREVDGDAKGEDEDENMPGLDGAIKHFHEKLEKLEGMMKTETGKKMARVRTDRLQLFRSWWEEEIKDSAGNI